jgi:hypothetical protein
MLALQPQHTLMTLHKILVPDLDKSFLIIQIKTQTIFWCQETLLVLP